MRRRLLVLLVAVLLLRGWVGQAMAAQMLARDLQPPPVAEASVAEPVHGPDCHGDAAYDESQDSNVCGSCLHCGDCTLHALPSVPGPVAGVAPVSPTYAASTTFTSAEPRSGSKPPIS